MSQFDPNSLPTMEFQSEAAIEAVVTPSPPESYQPLSLHEMRCNAATEIDWLWEGYIAAGNVTLLTSQWKCGKTTLLSVLLARLGSGGEVAGRRVRAGRAVVVSEEDPGHWLARGKLLDFGPTRWLC